MRHRDRCRVVVPLDIENALANPDDRLAAADLVARAAAATARLAGTPPLPAGRRVVRGIDQLGDRASAAG